MMREIFENSPTHFRGMPIRIVETIGTETRVVQEGAKRSRFDELRRRVAMAWNALRYGDCEGFDG